MGIRQAPHMLIAGGTGGDKTYFILTIIEALLKCNAVMYVLDPKNADLADLSVVMPEVYYKKKDITACIDRFYDGISALLYKLIYAVYHKFDYFLALTD